MKSKYPFISTVDLLLRIIWYLQWVFGMVLVFSALAILFDVNWFNVDKIKGFHIAFREIDLGTVRMHDQMGHPALITHGEGRLHITGLETNIILLRILGALLELLVGMYIILMLRRLFGNLKVGDFFVKANGTILKRIAYSIIGISLFLSLFQYAISSYLFAHLRIEDVVLKRAANLDTRTLLFGIMILVVATIFIKGAEMKEEQDLTI
jgi:hypothetical protein